jgi:hypothetical protein
MVMSSLVTCPSGVGTDTSECTAENVTKPDTGFATLLDELKYLRTMGNYVAGCPSGLFTFDEAAGGKMGASVPTASCNKLQWSAADGSTGTCELKDFFVGGEFNDTSTRQMHIHNKTLLAACG